MERVVGGDRENSRSGEVRNCKKGGGVVKGWCCVGEYSG